MKRIFTFLIVFAGFYGFGQVINFEDEELKNALLGNATNGYATVYDEFNSEVNLDINTDGEIDINEASNVYNISLSYTTTTSLGGLELFSNLESLSIISETLGHTDFTEYPALKNLTLTLNGENVIDFTNQNLPNIKSFICVGCGLTDFDLGNLPNVETLDLSGNLFETLTFSDHSALRALNLDLCPISALNLSNIPLLELNIGVAENRLNNLSQLNLNLETLVKLSIRGTLISELDLSGLPNIRELSLANNQNLTGNFSFVNLENLNSIGIGESSFESILLDNLPNLLTLLINYGNQNLSRITLSNTENLNSLNLKWEVDNPQFIFDSLPNLQFYELLLPQDPTETYVIENLPSLNHVYAEGSSMTSLFLKNLPLLTQVSLSDCPNLSSINFENTEGVEYLRLLNDDIISLDATMLPNLKFLGLNNNENLHSVFLKSGALNYEEEDVSFSFSTDNLQYVCIDYYNKGFMQNLWGFETVEVNSYCSFTPGGEYYGIEGTVRLSLLGEDCNENDRVIPNTKIVVDDGETQFYTYANALGNYSIPLETGVYTITPVIRNLDYYSSSPSSFSIELDGSIESEIQNICFVPNGEYNDLDIQIIPISVARPGFEAEYKILYKNKGTTPLTGSVNLDFEATLMDFAIANPVQSSFSEDELSWAFEDLMPFESREVFVMFSLNEPTDLQNPINDGDVLAFTATVNPINGDETPKDNVFRLNQTVVNSYDPNDKTCLQGDSVVPEMVGEYVHYMIRFENIGSAEAVNVVVKDVVNIEMFDVGTLQPLDASHDFVTRIKNGNEVEFLFENINLPFDDANNDGYVVFKIKTLDTLEVGDTFENNAEIYFDFNSPIITNTAVTNIETLSMQNISTENIQIQVYPNPVSSVLNIKSESFIKSVQIFDLNGKLILQMSSIGSQNQVELNVGELAKSVYLVKVQTANGAFVEKFVKK